MNGYNFTEEVRKSLALAREEASRLRHEYVGTEHVLLALIQEPDGTAAAILSSLDVVPGAMRQQIEGIVKKGVAAKATGPDLPYTTRAKKVLELAMNEAREMNDSYVGCEHLLLGLVGEGKGIAAQVLTESGVTLDAARAATWRSRGAEPPTRAQHEARAQLESLVLRRRMVQLRVRYFFKCAFLGTGASAVGILAADAALSVQRPPGITLLECVISGAIMAAFLLLVDLRTSRAL